MIERDKFVFNNTLTILEMLINSWAFCSGFKHRTAVEKLLNLSKEPMLPASTKTQILRICSALAGTISIDGIRSYSLARFDNSRGDVKMRDELNGLHRDAMDRNPFRGVDDKNMTRTITERNFLDPMRKKSILGDLMNAPGHQYVNRWENKVKTSYSKHDLDNIRTDGERRVYFSRVPSPR